MTNKTHCKLVCETEKDRFKISDFYDFTSYPITSFKSSSRRTKKRGLPASTAAGEGSSDMGAAEDDEWEDEDDENVTVQDGESIYDVESDDEEEIPEGTLTYGDSPFQLVLPSGARIGHRSMRRYCKQSFAVPLAPPALDPTRRAGRVRRLLEDKNSALVPRKVVLAHLGMGL
jgi:pre-60S factor REI1